MEIQFRPARPDDVNEAVPLIYSSGPTVFEYIFTHKKKGTSQAYLKNSFKNESSEFSFRKFTVAVVQDRVVGIGTSYGGSDVLGNTLGSGRNILDFYGPLFCWKVMWKGLRVEKILVPPKGNLHYITNLGVSPEWRSHGIGSKLIINLLEQGKSSRRTAAALDVAEDNPRAKDLYGRIGFVVVGLRRSKLSNIYGRVSSYFRMEKPL